MGVQKAGRRVIGAHPHFFSVIDPSPRLPGILRLLSECQGVQTFIYPITIFQLWFYFFPTWDASLRSLAYDVQKWDKLVHHTLFGLIWDAVSSNLTKISVLQCTASKANIFWPLLGSKTPIISNPVHHILHF